MAAIEANHYEQSRATLREDPIIREMYSGPSGIKNLPLTDVATYDEVTDTWDPKWPFITGSNQEYTQRGGQARRHIGAVSEVLIEMMVKDKVDSDED